MLFSLFTPTHKATYLKDAYASLQRQTVTDWEWVVVPNGPEYPEIRDYLAELTKGDKRVKIVTYNNATTSVGLLKKYACDQCTGDVLVEYDHDDVLATGCLAEISLRAAGCPANTFFFSDDVTCTFDGKLVLFDQSLGWKHYESELDGKKCMVNHNFRVHPRTLCEILYAPDHVRAWTRTAYYAAGGHNPSLDVCDDQELMIKTYMAGAHFEHIAKPLYVHRVSEENTSRVKIGRIGELNAQLRGKWLVPMVQEWCRREVLPMIDLGGAHNCPDGYIPLDSSFPHLNTRQLYDWANGGAWPDKLGGDVFAILAAMKDNSVGCFRAHDFLEHIPPSDVVHLMNQLYRKLVPGGFLLTHTPAVCDNEGRCGRGAYQDPDHKSFWSTNNFWYFTKKEQAKYAPDVKCRFQTVREANHYPTDWHKMHLIPYVLWDGMALKDDDKSNLPGPKSI